MNQISPFSLLYYLFELYLIQFIAHWLIYGLQGMFNIITVFPVNLIVFIFNLCGAIVLVKLFGKEE